MCFSSTKQIYGENILFNRKNLCCAVLCTLFGRAAENNKYQTTLSDRVSGRTGGKCKAKHKELNNNTK